MQGGARELRTPVGVRGGRGCVGFAGVRQMIMIHVATLRKKCEGGSGHEGGSPLPVRSGVGDCCGKTERFGSAYGWARGGDLS